MPHLRIDPSRLWSALEEMAAVGGTPEGGVDRPALSAADGAARDLLRRHCDSLGLRTAVDRLGNMFARRDGTDPARRPVLFGSHLDSQPTGGRFDGALGVVAGLEVMRALADVGSTTAAPLVLVNWTNEEGWRFRPPTTGSLAFAGKLPVAEALALRDAAGVALGEALDAIGYDGDADVGFAADSLFELHIEQGPVLEDAGVPVGVVTGAAGKHRVEVSVIGRAAHAATTPMDGRRDALAGAAEMIAAVEEAGRGCAGLGRSTVGRLELAPNSRNVVPGEVRFSVDLRHDDAAGLTGLAEEVDARLHRIAENRGLTLQIGPAEGYPPQPFDADCTGHVREAARALGHAHIDLTSGAGHDAVALASSLPVAMIFVPCRDGISHAPDESVEPDDAAAGAEVLAAAVLARAA